MTKDSLRAELDALLNEDLAASRRREQSAFDELAAPFTDSLVLFGAGNLGHKALQGLRSAGIEPLAFSDNNPSLWGKTVEGIPILSPREATERFGKSAAFIMTVWRGEGTDTMAERCQPLTDLGCVKVLNFGVVFWKYPEAFLPHYSFDLPHKVLEQADNVRNVFDLWEDEPSRKEFVAQIRWRLHLDFDGLPRPVKHETYFPEDLVSVSDDEVFVDCGAFDGDTMASFLRSRGEDFGGYIAFEADPTNFEKLRRNVSELPIKLQKKITIHPLAVGERREKVRFEATGTESSAVGHGALEIDCVPLDEMAAVANPTWLKMDIEGSEPAALKGARGLIANQAPVLAVCVYHQQDHVWKIPRLINEMSSEYHFFLRPHLLESWDLVCYAIPASRLKRV
jgi:FkbM family methyltransferase